MKRFVAYTPWLMACLSFLGTWTRAESPRVFATEQTNWWAFRPVQATTLPAVKDSGWVRSPIDRFILAKLEKQGLKPSPPAGRRALCRRLYFDLLGLPPGPEELETFLADSSPDATSRLTERLLASPRYGERWGRHWMDVVRYADTAGDNADYPIPEAHLYRDYVIDAFNADKTDEYGGSIARDPVHVHDYHATILHLLGLDHTQLTYRYAGRDFRLTDVAGNVVRGVLA